MDFNYIKSLLPKRPEDSHKGMFGQVLNIAGSGFYSGAAYFSSIAPLKVGCGRSTLASVEVVLRAVASLAPDIILKPLPETKEKTISPKALEILSPVLKNYDVISIGCGLSINKGTEKFFKKLIYELKETDIPLVIDADGLNILANINVNLPKNTILTPHPTELSRLLGVSTIEILEDTEMWARKCSRKYNCITVLKTHKTVISDVEGKTYINETGNSALSHGGSGDVLCGMITGFLAQCVKPYEACILASYLLGRASEIASKELTEYSTLTSDLLNYVHLAIRELS